MTAPHSSISAHRARPLLAGLLLLTTRTEAQEPSYSFTTLAGVTLQRAIVDGTGTDARFDSPYGIAVDSANNVFVSEYFGHVIRKITPAGVVTTFVGEPGVLGAVDGPASVARLNRPSQVAFDRNGDLLFADYGTSTIRKVAPDGRVSTIAGGVGVRSTVNGTLATARFNGPTGVATDAAGNLYVGEWDACVIRKITADGVVTTLAGTPGAFGSADGVGAAARFFHPENLCVDSTGNLFVADYSNFIVRKITPAGNVTTFAGVAGSSGAADGLGSAARFTLPFGLAIDRLDNLYVADINNQVIRKITPAGLVSTIGGTVGAAGNVDGIGAEARFGGPRGMAIAADGTLFIAELGNTIRKGTLLSPPAAPTIITTPAAGTARISNLSVRSVAGAGANTLIVGFSLSGTGTNPMLVRAIGPTLASFGVTGALADPTLRLDATGGPTLAQNNDWGGGAVISGAAAGVGAFALAAASRDAALLQPLTPGSYTAQVGGGSGIALVELYETDASAGARLVNVAARTSVGTGGDILIAGFAIAGDVAKTVLVRAVGPTLAQFGVGGTLSDPRLQLFRGSSLAAENDDWGIATSGNVPSTATFSLVGAFPLPPGSKDAALLVTLSPGSYTAQVSGNGDGTGVALVEVYEVQ